MVTPCKSMELPSTKRSQEVKSSVSIGPHSVTGHDSWDWSLRFFHPFPLFKYYSSEKKRDGSRFRWSRGTCWIFGCSGHHMANSLQFTLHHPSMNLLVTGYRWVKAKAPSHALAILSSWQWEIPCFETCNVANPIVNQPVGDSLCVFVPFWF